MIIVFRPLIRDPKRVHSYIHYTYLTNMYWLEFVNRNLNYERGRLFDKIEQYTLTTLLYCVICVILR